MKIEKLTNEDIARLPVVRDKWLKIGLSTEPTDRSMAEVAIKKSYNLAGLKDPKFFIWLDSPFAGAMTSALLTSRALAGNQVLNQVYQDRQ